MQNVGLGPINLLLLLPPAVALVIAMRILFGRSRPRTAEPMHVLLSVASTTLFVFSTLGGLVGTMGIFFLFIPIPLMCIVLIFMVHDRTRRSEHRSLVWALSAAAGRGIPLPEAARAFGDETPSRTGVKSLRLAEGLEQGQSLWIAARNARLRMGTAVRLSVKMGEALGLLGPAMKQQIEDSQEIDSALRDAIGRLFYLAIIIIVMQAIMTFLMLKIVPVFQKMFEEFGLRLPAMTLWVIDGSKWFVEYGWLIVSPLITLYVLFNTVLMLAAAWQFLVELWPTNSAGQAAGASVLMYALVALLMTCLGVIFWLPMAVFGPAILFYIGWFPRGFFLIWPLFRRYDGALVMRGLSLAIRRGLPMPDALRLVQDSYPLAVVRGRLRWALYGVEAGENWKQSLLKTKLITPTDVAVLAAAERVGNLDWALDEMAAASLRRQAHRVQVSLQFIFPLLLLSVGLLVFVIVCGLFMPLISLIQGLT